jgi:hypothetical protein
MFLYPISRFLKINPLIVSKNSLLGIPNKESTRSLLCPSTTESPKAQTIPLFNPVKCPTFPRSQPLGPKKVLAFKVSVS